MPEEMALVYIAALERRVEELEAELVQCREDDENCMRNKKEPPKVVGKNNTES